MQDPNDPNENEPEIYHEEHELGGSGCHGAESWARWPAAQVPNPFPECREGR